MELHVSSNSIRKEEFVESMLVMLLPCPLLNPATIFLWWSLQMAPLDDYIISSSYPASYFTQGAQEKDWESTKEHTRVFTEASGSAMGS